MQVERIENDVRVWSSEEDEELKSAALEDLLRRLEEIIKKFPRLYASQRAHFLKGSVYFQVGQWDLSARSFQQISEQFPKSYLASIGLINAAVAKEEEAAYAEAITLYEQVVAEYQETSPEIARVLFSLGRLYEVTGNSEIAKEQYNTIIDRHSNSSWTNLARNRIIVLTIEQ